MGIIELVLTNFWAFVAAFVIITTLVDAVVTLGTAYLNSKKRDAQDEAANIVTNFSNIGITDDGRVQVYHTAHGWKILSVDEKTGRVYLLNEEAKVSA